MTSIQILRDSLARYKVHYVTARNLPNFDYVSWLVGASQNCIENDARRYVMEQLDPYWNDL